MKKYLRTSLVAAIMAISGGATASETAIQMLTTSGCGCCTGWARHLEQAGYTVTRENLAMGDLWQRKMAFGLKEGMTACHTGLVAGYILEGHIPAKEVNRLLTERPNAVGLVVPDMPYGSPGMGDASSPDAEPYKVLLLRKDGTTEVYATYP